MLNISEKNSGSRLQDNPNYSLIALKMKNKLNFSERNFNKKVFQSKKVFQTKKAIRIKRDKSHLKIGRYHRKNKFH